MRRLVFPTNLSFNVNENETRHIYLCNTNQNENIRLIPKDVLVERIKNSEQFKELPNNVRYRHMLPKQHIHEKDKITSLITSLSNSTITEIHTIHDGIYEVQDSKGSLYKLPKSTVYIIYF